MIKRLGMLIIIVLGLCSAYGQIYHYKLNDKNSGREAAGPESIVLSSDVLFNGEPTIRFTLNKTDKLVNNGKRAEISFKAEQSIPVERWYAFNIWLPESYATDPVPESVVQWHASPDFSLGEDYRSPPLALFIQDGLWQLNTRWASNPVNDNNNISGKMIGDFGKAETGKWTQFVFHIRFSYKSDGFVQVWKNGERIYSVVGPNYYNDKVGPYFKFGIYKWEWANENLSTNINRRVLYFGDVSFGDENASIDDFIK